MRSFTFLIFISIILSIYLFAHYYIWNRTNIVFAGNDHWRKVIKIIILVGGISFFLGEILEHTVSSMPGEQIYRIGAFWLAALLYFFIGYVIFDIFRLVNHILPLAVKTTSLEKYYLLIGKIMTISIFTLVLFGYYNALHPKIKKIDLHINKIVKGKKDLKVLLATDIHLGALCGDIRERKLVKLIQSQQPDLVLLGGDIVDGDLGPVLRKNLGKHLNEIKPPLGMFGIPGNHEYIGGSKKTLPYLESIGLKILRDETVYLPNGVAIIGRDEREASRFNGYSRKTLNELVADIPNKAPVIVLNHQPYPLEEAVENGIDLHLSGHTHHGQLWPLGYITKAIFDISWGLEKRKNTNFYVSSGFGTWGPPVRTGNHPEVVIFNLHFEKNNH